MSSRAWASAERIERSRKAASFSDTPLSRPWPKDRISRLTACVAWVAAKESKLSYPLKGNLIAEYETGTFTHDATLVVKNTSSKQDS